MLAAENGHVLVVSMLLYLGADPAVRDMFKRTALDIARKGNQPEVITALHKYGKCV